METQNKQHYTPSFSPLFMLFSVSPASMWFSVSLCFPPTGLIQRRGTSVTVFVLIAHSVSGSVQQTEQLRVGPLSVI